MNFKNVDRQAIDRSYRRHNFQRLLYILHWILPLAIVVLSPAELDGFLESICSIMPITIIFHTLWLFYYSRKEYKLRRLLGDKHVVVPVAKSSNYDSPERVPQYVRTVDGELLEIMEDEAAEFDREPTAPDELQMD